MQLTENEVFLMHCISQLKGTNDFARIATDMKIVTHFAARQKMVRFRKAFKEHLEAAGIHHEDDEDDEPITPKKQRKKDVLSASGKASRVEKTPKGGLKKGKVVGRMPMDGSGDEGKEEAEMEKEAEAEA